MKRRLFVKLLTAVTAGMYLPVVGCNGSDLRITTLSQPTALQHICDAETIRTIGKAYQELAPRENKETLVKLLAGDADHEINNSAESSLISSTLEKKVQQDFQENKTIVV